MKRHGRPYVIVTDKLRSYGAAMKIIGNTEKQETGRWVNNRAENSHQPYPFILWANNWIRKYTSPVWGGSFAFRDGLYDGALIIDRQGNGYRVLSAKRGGIYFEGILALFDWFSPESRGYKAELELSEPEKLDFEKTKAEMIDCIFKKRWHHTGQGIPSKVLLSSIREARNFAEQVDSFDFSFGG
jgi:hypothetical protein